MKMSHFVAGVALAASLSIAPAIVFAQTSTGANPNHLSYTGKVSQVGTSEFTMVPRKGPLSVTVTATPKTVYVLMNRILPTQVGAGDKVVVNGTVNTTNHTILADRVVDVPAALAGDKIGERLSGGKDTAKRIVGSVTTVTPAFTITDNTGAVYTVTTAPRVRIFQPSLGAASNVQFGNEVQVEGESGAEANTLVARRVLISVANPARSRRLSRRKAV